MASVPGAECCRSISTDRRPPHQCSQPRGVGALSGWRPERRASLGNRKHRVLLMLADHSDDLGCNGRRGDSPPTSFAAPDKSGQAPSGATEKKCHYVLQSSTIWMSCEPSAGIQQYFDLARREGLTACSVQGQALSLPDCPCGRSTKSSALQHASVPVGHCLAQPSGW